MKRLMPFKINGKPCAIYKCHTWYVALYTSQYSDKAQTKIFPSEAEAENWLKEHKDKAEATTFWWQKEEA